MNRRDLIRLSAYVGPLAAVTVAAPTQVRAAGAGGGGSSSRAGYLALATVTASIVRLDGRSGVMTVETGIDVPDPALHARAEQARPRLRAAYAEVVQRAASGLRPGVAPDVEGLSDALQAATTQVLGRRGATLLLGTVMAI